MLELGCGTGRDAANVLARLPRGQVIAIDASTRMLAGVEETRKALQDNGFQDADVRLVRDSATLTAGTQLESYLATCICSSVPCAADSARPRELGPQRRCRTFYSRSQRPGVGVFEPR